jgi:hypothetical protein
MKRSIAEVVHHANESIRWIASHRSTPLSLDALAVED